MPGIGLQSVIVVFPEILIDFFYLLPIVVYNSSEVSGESGYLRTSRSPKPSRLDSAIRTQTHVLDQMTSFSYHQSTHTFVEVCESLMIARLHKYYI